MMPRRETCARPDGARLPADGAGGLATWTTLRLEYGAGQQGSYMSDSEHIPSEECRRAGARGAEPLPPLDTIQTSEPGRMHIKIAIEPVAVQ